MSREDGGGSIEASFPRFFVEADRHAVVWQRMYLGLERLQLVALVLAAVCSTVAGAEWRVTAFVLVVVGFGAQLVRVVLRADQKWWNGRALAETVKTTSWKYCVGGDPFPIGQPDADDAFGGRLRRFGDQFAELAPISLEDDPISPAMRALRGRPLADRVEAYLAQRIQDQKDWYAGKAAWNHHRSGFWTIVAVALQVLAVGIGLLTLADGSWSAWDLVEFEWVGVLTSAIAAVVAWTAVKQHDSIEQAYRNAALELQVIEDEFPKERRDETTWADFVDRSEQAISREHTSWLASQSPAHAGGVA